MFGKKASATCDQNGPNECKYQKERNERQLSVLIEMNFASGKAVTSLSVGWGMNAVEGGNRRSRELGKRLSERLILIDVGYAHGTAVVSKILERRMFGHQ